MRSRSRAARSNSSASAACVHLARQQIAHRAAFAGQKIARLARPARHNRRGEISPVQGAGAALDLIQQAGPRAVLVKGLSAQERSRKARCSAFSVRLTAQTLAKGPK